MHHHHVIPHTQTSSHLAMVGVVVLILFLLITNIVLSSQLMQLGSRLTSFQQQADNLEATTQKIDQELALNNSLTDLENQANLLGYTKDIRYLSLPNTLALKP